MVQVSEGSGGQVFLLDPSEVASSATLLMARDGHDETLRRVVGELDAGVRTIEVHVDTSVERVLFSVSLQCLQEIEIVRPSGAPVAASDPGVTWTAFQAGRQVGIAQPEAGLWKVQLAGKGLLFLVVHARASLSLDGVRLVRPGGRPGHEGTVPRRRAAGAWHAAAAWRSRSHAGILEPTLRCAVRPTNDWAQLPPVRAARRRRRADLPLGVPRARRPLSRGRDRTRHRGQYRATRARLALPAQPNALESAARAVSPRDEDSSCRRPLPDVFRFFADARNLEAITPPFLRFKVLTPDVVMRQGARIDYRLRLRGIPFRWQSEITAWEPNVRFKDEQRRGPYKYWRHVHLFRESAGGTLVEDGVEYEVPCGPSAAPVARRA